MRDLLVGVVIAIVSAAAAAGNEENAPRAPNQEMLDRRARDYRIEVYRTFRLNRDEFDRRRAAWSRVHAAWQHSGADPQEIGTLVSWLDAATKASAGDMPRPLPADPRFGGNVPQVAPAEVGDTPPVAVTEPPYEPPAIQPPPVVAKPPDARSVVTLPVAEPDYPAETAVARINVSELAAGIAGHNFALRAVETDLLQAPASDVDALRSAIERLEGLATRRGDLLLYYDLLSPGVQTRVEPLAVPAEVIALVGNQISNIREELERTDASAGRESSLAALDQLSKRLAELVTTMNSTEEPLP